MVSDMRLRLFDVAKDHTGSALVEFTFVLPVLMFILLGIAQFGLIFYDYHLVAYAAASGARNLAISRLDSTAYADTVTVINRAAGGLSGLTVTMTVNGAAGSCSADPACQNNLQSAYAAAAVPPEPVSVTVSYQCNANAILPINWINMTGVCPVATTIQQAVE
jgi:Flp pilus assembly protein TadG